MERVISATALARRLGDVLGRIRYRGESFVIERNGVAVARLIPAGTDRHAPVAEALRRGRKGGERRSTHCSRRRPSLILDLVQQNDGRISTLSSVGVAS